MNGNCCFHGNRREADQGVACLICQCCPYGIRAGSQAGCKVEVYRDNDRPLVYLQRNLGEIQLSRNGIRKADHHTVDFPGALDLQRSADEIRVGRNRRIDVPSVPNDKEEQNATFLTRLYRFGRGFHAKAEHGRGIAAGAGYGSPGKMQGKGKGDKSQVVHRFRAREE
jgi:hypothetical protein